MPLTTTTPRNSSRTGKPFHPGQRHRANFARQATIDAFGRHARALDWDDFTDRQPSATSVPSPEARFK